MADPPQPGLSRLVECQLARRRGMPQCASESLLFPPSGKYRRSGNSRWSEAPVANAVRPQRKGADCLGEVVVARPRGGPRSRSARWQVRPERSGLGRSARAGEIPLREVDRSSAVAATLVVPTRLRRYRPTRPMFGDAVARDAVDTRAVDRFDAGPVVIARRSHPGARLPVRQQFVGRRRFAITANRQQ